ncbi:hypothetical protein JCM10908_005615 [Rhodotorula pacifica]|uniref:MFS transporter n=1 Tax=Rhodotorula pacifica TaxID=1495444 RepID=UPI00317C5DA1
MQSILLCRRLKTRYSLLVPFPPLPFAYPPVPPVRPPRPDLRIRTSSPSPPPAFLRLAALQPRSGDEVRMEEINQPEGAGVGVGVGARWDAIEEIPPSPDHQSSNRPSTMTTPDGSAAEPKEVFLVEFSKLHDPLNPQCWSMLKRIWTTFILCQLVLFSGAASSMNAYVAPKASRDLGVSETVVSLDTALFLVGFGVAAPIAAPLSELAGRNMVYLVSLAAFALLEVGAASCVSIASRCVVRFIAGCFASSPLSNAAAGIGDLWSASERTVVFPVFAAFGLTGPCLGPVIGGWIAQSRLAYRWTDWVQAIWAMALLVIVFFCLAETYPPTILRWKAKAICTRNRDPRYLSPLEAKRLRISFKRDFLRTLARPFEMLVLEPIVMCFLAYLTLVFVVLFGALVAYPFIFASYNLTLKRTPGRLGTLFLAIPTGLILCTMILVPLAWVDYQRCIDRAGLRFAVAPPEARLRAAMIGTWAIPAGLLWTAWTIHGRYSICHLLGGQALFGFGFLTCFVSSYLYLIDSYGHAAASALSAVTFLRYLVSGGAVIFTPPMYRHLTTKWAMTLLACLAFALSFVPWLFYFCGARMRSWSRWTLH